MPAAPDTIVLIHGLWVTPRSWEGWKARYEAQGYRVLTPTYPGFGEVEAMRADDSAIAAASVPDTVAHLASVIETVDTPPILMGHSFGGMLTQLLLAKGLGAAGVAIDSAPPEGVRVTPPSQARSLFPALRNPANFHRAVGFTKAEWHYAFTNTLSREESDAVWERYAIAAPGNWVWAYGLLANWRPGRQETWVDYSVDRAPLLFIAGEKDHIMPPAVNRANAKRWGRSPAVTDLIELPGRDHWTCGAPGWEDVADRALAWALESAGRSSLAA
ncbi:alpha/beta hydrolase [Demequina gelatinilytica]|uniref:alpha/beta hydrolase n=1 Tax=Demequina gelatinilytica TaxID=1638980 RepID=UPI000784B181|nr:alpha/beta hydrolase [Demequina gelatinilytica]